MDFEKSCRLCLSTEGPMEDIFTEDSNFYQKIYECVGIEVKFHSELPSCICELCKSELIVWEKFKRQCLKTEEYLQQMMQDLFQNETDYVTDLLSILPEEEQNSESISEVFIPEKTVYNNDHDDNNDNTNTSIYESDKMLNSEIEENSTTIMEKESENSSHKDVGYTLREDDNDDNNDAIEILAIIDYDEHVSININENEDCNKRKDSFNDENKEIIEIVMQTKSKKGQEVWKSVAGNRIRYHTKCKICGTLQQNIKQHMLIHTDELPFQCPYCEKGFRQKSNYKHHVYIHTGEKPYNCKICNKSFADPGSVRSHMILHTGERRYRCDICNKAFGHSHTLAVHKKIHTQDKRYLCDLCSKRFISNHALKKHVRTHTGEKPYECDKCPKKFSTSGNLLTHKKVHTKERPFICNECGQDFGYRSVLNKHVKTHLKRDNENEYLVEN